MGHRSLLACGSAGCGAGPEPDARGAERREGPARDHDRRVESSVDSCGSSSDGVLVRVSWRHVACGGRLWDEGALVLAVGAGLTLECYGVARCARRAGVRW